jgi:hypothetical protein
VLVPFIRSHCLCWLLLVAIIGFTQKVLPSFLSFIPFHFLSTQDLDRNDCVNVFLIKFVTRFCTGVI